MLIINRKNSPSQVVGHDLNRTKSLSKILEKIFSKKANNCLLIDFTNVFDIPAKIQK